LEEIEKGVSKRLGRDHTFLKKVCIYLSHQYSGLGLDEIGAYWGMEGSTISQLSRRFKEAIKGDRELGETLNEIKGESLLNVET